MTEPTYYNHMCDVGFVVISTDPTGENLTEDELLDAMQTRINYLRHHKNEVIEAVGMPSDTYQESMISPSTFLSDFLKSKDARKEGANIRVINPGRWNDGCLGRITLCWSDSSYSVTYYVDGKPYDDRLKSYEFEVMS